MDKPAMPFTGARTISIENPCFPFDTCQPTYGFINRLSLTNDTSVFGEKVRDTPISGNQDGPEGGMDALLQAMACSVSIMHTKFESPDRSGISTQISNCFCLLTF